MGRQLGSGNPALKLSGRVREARYQKLPGANPLLSIIESTSSTIYY